MAAVREEGGRYVSSSIPKILILPIASRWQANNNKHKPNEHADVLYALATSKNSSKYQKSAKSKKRGGVLDDPECLPPVPGREHITVQTDLYLEELCDVIQEADESCQTDPLLDRPPSPLFVPAKIGVDVGTQIWTGDLFDFDEEVQPLLEALVSQTIEQSLIEIVASEDLLALKQQQEEYEVRRNVEVADRLRLQDQERRLLEEREKRLKEQEEAVKLEEDTTQKIAACVYAQNYLSDLLPKVYKRLETQGYFATQVPEIQQVEEDFWPWLMKEVDLEISTLEASYDLLDSLIEDAVQNVTKSAVIRPVTPDVYPEKTEAEETESKDELVAEEEEVEEEEEEQQHTDLIDETEE